MNNIVFEGPVLWSQIDANVHMRHSAYADFGAQARLELLDKIGLNMERLEALSVGPILFREELMYLREVRINDVIRVSVELTKCRPDVSRWSFRHELFRKDGIKVAIINVDGAWIDMEKRKLTTLPESVIPSFLENIPRSTDFIMEEPKTV